MSAPAIKRVGFIGIGNMGWPMAANLVKAGFDVSVADAVPGRAAKFMAEVGGKAATGAADAAVGADAIVTILPTSKHVAEVVAQIKERLSPGALVVEMSSGVPGVTRVLAAGLLSGWGILDIIGAILIAIVGLAALAVHY